MLRKEMQLGKRILWARVNMKSNPKQRAAGGGGTNNPGRRHSVHSSAYRTDALASSKDTADCFIYYRKSVLHLLKRMFHVRISRCSTDLR